MIELDPAKLLEQHRRQAAAAMAELQPAAWMPPYHRDGKGAGPSGLLGRVAARNMLQMLVTVDPIRSEVDPAQMGQYVVYADAWTPTALPDIWAEAPGGGPQTAYFNVSQRLVAWLGNFTLVYVGQPVLVFYPTNTRWPLAIPLVRDYDGAAVDPLDPLNNGRNPDFRCAEPAENVVAEAEPTFISIIYGSTPGTECEDWYDTPQEPENAGGCIVIGPDVRHDPALPQDPYPPEPPP